jgi:uncharacterized protein DUF2877
VLVRSVEATPLRPVAIGAIAHAALSRAGGTVRVLAHMTASTYITAGDQIAWLGPATACLHPRAILLADAWTGGTAGLRVTTAELSPWRPRAVRVDTTAARALVAGWRRLTDGMDRLGRPRGFGARLAGRPLGWPLGAASAAADALALACARDDATAAGEQALALLGVGHGLTPSGDDFVGAALFARRLLTQAGIADAVAWNRATDTILAAAPARTHPISVVLLGDLAAGLGWKPLHDLVSALTGHAADLAEESARRLVGVGHSSGWDLLAGFGAGLGALA